jgi:hypothetical protein
VLPPLYTPVASTASVAAVFVVGLPLHLRQPPCFTFSIPLRTVRPQVLFPLRFLFCGLQIFIYFPVHRVSYPVYSMN